ncbi:DUF3854 domain-containing protein [Synechococcus sp. Tobar12-5m-g]|uniref:phage/plasmid primase, P4 family n=1 Tax=unclassified Synechococcus TaxID=2626047 RepID=UPI0020CD9219|nr:MULTISPECIES: phage/plasmid primase, P4 family [unclassified Synechococcus]MCP9771634.1 DUF3854 domain-containing protein [Synechococcus sp. Tobar12-5m-g]MCP9872575.1 DUF3854 domain-containing protein [Synechococcus sp. Cruz CV-v-12]
MSNTNTSTSAAAHYGQPLTEEQKDWLSSCAIDDRRVKGITRIETIADLPPEFTTWGRKAVPSYCFTWTSASGIVTRQLRPDSPPLGEDGKPIKYLFPKGSGGRVGIAPGFEQHQRDPRIPLLLVEGTKQLLATASNISEDNPIAVPCGIAGCYGWLEKDKQGDSRPSRDLEHLALEGREVLAGFDADVTTNYNVYSAAKRLKEHLLTVCLAKSVRFLEIPGGGKDGMDDLLGRIPQDRRPRVLHKLIEDAKPLPGKGPRRPAKDGSGFFSPEGNLRTQTLWEYLQQEHHLAMAGDQSIAVYREGVYLNGKSRCFEREVGQVLGDYFKQEHFNTVHSFGLVDLKTSGQEIPLKQSCLRINFRNGLLDPMTGILHPHTPKHLTLIQWPFNWDPKAACPTFDRWLEEQLPGQGPALLEYCSQMLDQSTYPSWMVFLWGPSKSGKSTFLRLLRALAGPVLSSCVSLHSLSAKGTGEGRFAPARLFGKVLNAFADLSSDDLGDLSILKCLTGGDPIHAEYKGKDGFDLENMAMLVFSANSIPAVSESSKAYLARSAVFNFANSFIGKEDPGIEDRMAQELPGIMRRLTEALMARKHRGRPLPCDEAAAEQFRLASDKVALFLSERTRPGDRSMRCITRATLYQQFVEWSQEEQGNKNARVLGKQKFNARVHNAEVELFKPAGDVLRWNLLPSNSETAEHDPPKLPSVGISKGAAASQAPPSGPSAVSNSQNCREQNPVGESDLPGRSAVSAVLPYSSPPSNGIQKTPGNREWVETAETAEGLSAPSRASVAPIAPADPPPAGLQTSREHVEHALEQLKLAPCHPGARDAAYDHLGGAVPRQRVAEIVQELIEAEQEDQPDLFEQEGQ